MILSYHGTEMMYGSLYQIRISNSPHTIQNLRKFWRRATYMCQLTTSHSSVVHCFRLDSHESRHKGDSLVRNPHNLSLSVSLSLSLSIYIYIYHYQISNHEPDLFGQVQAEEFLNTGINTHEVTSISVKQCVPGGVMEQLQPNPAHKALPVYKLQPLICSCRPGHRHVTISIFPISNEMRRLLSLIHVINPSCLYWCP